MALGWVGDGWWGVFVVILGRRALLSVGLCVLLALLAMGAALARWEGVLFVALRMAAMMISGVRRVMRGCRMGFVPFFFSDVFASRMIGCSGRMRRSALDSSLWRCITRLMTMHLGRERFWGSVLGAGAIVLLV